MNKPIIQIALIPICALIMYSSSCKKDKPTICSPENTVRFPKDMLDRFIFKDSTYWIYQDSASLEIDSVWVYKSEYSIINQDIENSISEGKCFEYLLLYLNSTINNKYEINLHCVSSKLGTPYEKEVFEILHYKNNLILEDFSMKGNKYVSFDTFAHKALNFDSIQVSSIKYRDILLHINFEGAYIYSESYYAPNVGLIKYRLRNGSVWNLIRKNIKQ